MTYLNSPTIFSQNYRIYLEDTDAGGIVYHANHFKFFERCRRDWLRTLGMTSYFYQSHSAENTLESDLPNIQFVVNEAQIKYLRPILLDSLVTVSITDMTIKNSSLMLEQKIFLNNQPLSEATIGIVCVTTTKNETGQTQICPTRLPQDFLDLIKS